MGRAGIGGAGVGVADVRGEELDPGVARIVAEESDRGGNEGGFRISRGCRCRRGDQEAGAAGGRNSGIFGVIGVHSGIVSAIIVQCINAVIYWSIRDGKGCARWRGIRVDLAASLDADPQTAYTTTCEKRDKPTEIGMADTTSPQQTIEPPRPGTVRIPGCVKQRFHIRPEQLRAFCETNRIAELAFFGSVLRDDFGPDSDVDVVYRPGPGFHHRRKGAAFRDCRRELGKELGKILGRRVDMVSADAVESRANAHRTLSREIPENREIAYTTGRMRESHLAPSVPASTDRAERTHRDALEVMLEHARRAITWLGDRTAGQLAADHMTFDALTHTVVHVGETCGKLDADFRDMHRHIPWDELARLAERCTREYYNIKPEVLREAVLRTFPDLVALLERHVLQAERSGVVRDRDSGREPLDP